MCSTLVSNPVKKNRCLWRESRREPPMKDQSLDLWVSGWFQSHPAVRNPLQTLTGMNDCHLDTSFRSKVLPLL